MIVTGGENVYSGEIEAVICEHPAVHEAAVFIADNLSPITRFAPRRVLSDGAAEERLRQDPQENSAGALLGS
jgi:acyl-coenzyme A synthetase/AMP-(fatty) acid ligase